VNRQGQSQEDVSRAVVRPSDTVEFPTLQRAFRVESLGDGNRMAGINQLSAMAIVLANLARPGSGIITPEGRRLEVCCSLLATGPVVSSAILDDVLTPVRRCQDNLLSQLDRYHKSDVAEASRETGRRWEANSPSPDAGESALFDLAAGNPDIPPLFGDRKDQWIDVVASAPSESVAGLVRHPRIYVAAPTPKLLEQQLPGSHLGMPLVALNLNHAADAGKFGNICPLLMDGLIPAGPSGESVIGRMLVTDPRGLLREVATTNEDKAAWLARLLWLVDGDSSAGPNPGTPAVNEHVVSLPRLHSRFENAVKRGFADRLDTRTSGPIEYEYDLTAAQCRWMAFLADMEKSVPGITTVARRLLVTLVFGLRQLVTADKIPNGFHYPDEDVEALARLLVRRMANHRASLLFSAADTRRMKDKRRIFDKLADGAHDSRSIYKPLHIQADYCRDLLSEMKVDNFVERNASLWNRIEGRTLTANSSEHLQLDI